MDLISTFSKEMIAILISTLLLKMGALLILKDEEWSEVITFPPPTLIWGAGMTLA